MIAKEQVITILKNLNFPDSEKERNFILSIVDKINKKLEEIGEIDPNTGGEWEIRIPLTKKELAAVWAYDLDPPRINALYAICNFYFSSPGWETHISDEVSGEKFSLVIKITLSTKIA